MNHRVGVTNRRTRVRCLLGYMRTGLFNIRVGVGVRVEVRVGVGLIRQNSAFIRCV